MNRILIFPKNKKWLKAAKLEKPFGSLSQAFSQPSPPQKVNKSRPSSQPKQWNWMAQTKDPFREAREASSKSQEIREKNNKPQKPRKPLETRPDEHETSEQLTPQPEQSNWLDQPLDSFREAREAMSNNNEQEYLPSETVPAWKPQQENGFQQEWMTEHTEPTFEITMEEDPTFTSQEVVQRPRSAVRENSDKNLRSEISSRHNFNPTAAGGYLEGADDSSLTPSPQMMEGAFNTWIQAITWMKISCRQPTRTVPVKQMNQ
jgi:hypothetical protein